MFLYTKYSFLIFFLIFLYIPVIYFNYSDLLWFGYRHVHLQLCLISRELNKIFGISMTLQMGCYFVIFVDVSRHIYRSYIDKNTDITIGQTLDNLFTYIWGVIHNAKFLALNLMCQTLCNEVTEWNNCQLIIINIVETKRYKFCNNKKYNNK